VVPSHLSAFPSSHKQRRTMRSLLIALCLLLALAFVTAEEAETIEVDETAEFEEAAQAEEVEEVEEEEVDEVQLNALKTKAAKKTAKKTPPKKTTPKKTTPKKTTPKKTTPKKTTPKKTTPKKTTPKKTTPKKTTPKKTLPKKTTPKKTTPKKTVTKPVLKPSMSAMATTVKPCYRKPYNGTFKKLLPPTLLSVNVTFRHFTKIQWKMPLDAPKNATFLIRYWSIDDPVILRGMRQKIKTKPGETFMRINKLLRPGIYRMRIRTVAKCFTKSDWVNLQFNITTRRQQIQALRLSAAPTTAPSHPVGATQPPSRSRI